MDPRSSEQARTAFQPALRAGHILAVASGKGGVGKTWLSIMLAHLFARSGRSVMLFDGDIGLANVDVQLGLTPEKDLRHLFAQGLTLEQIVTPYEGGFDIVAGRSGHGGLASLSQAQMQQLKEQITNSARHYDVVVLDLGAGVEEHVRFLASLAHKCLVVITDEPTSLTDAYAFIKLCLSRKPTPEIAIAVNQAASIRDGKKTFDALRKACSTFLNHTPELAGIIRRDARVKDSIRNQETLLLRSPHSTASGDAAALSVKLLSRP